MPQLTAILPPDVTELSGLVLLGISFLSSFITVGFGIGGGAVLLAAMAALVPPTALIPVHAVVQVGSNLGRAVYLFRHISWGAMGMFAVGSVIGVTVGGMLVVNMPPAYVQIGVGLFIIWSIFTQPPQWMRRWPVVTGWVSSFLTMFFGATGPFVATYTKSFGLPRHGHVATHSALMTVQHLLKSIAFGFLGFAFAPWAAFIALMILAGLIGTAVGRLVLNSLTDTYFRRALDFVLLLISLRLIWSGIGML